MSAGAVNSPKLLQLSGIGPGKLIADLGLPVAVELPGVGENYRDHFGVRMVAGIEGVPTINRMAQGLPLLGEIARWLLRRPSLLAVSPSLAHLFWMSREGLARPDLMCVFTPASFRAGVVGLLDVPDGMTTGVWPARPESEVTLGDLELIHSRLLLSSRAICADDDQRVLLGGMRLVRRLYESAAFKPYLSGRFTPALNVSSDDELLDWARKRGRPSITW